MENLICFELNERELQQLSDLAHPRNVDAFAKRLVQQYLTRELLKSDRIKRRTARREERREAREGEHADR